MKSENIWHLLAAVLVSMSTCVFASVGERAHGADASQNWWDDSPWGDPERGFNWYPDPSTKPDKEQKKKEAPRQRTLSEMDSLDEINKEIKRLKEQAILNPTEKNIHDFLKAQDWLMSKSATFADVSRRVVWGNADVNYQARSPATNFVRAKDINRKSKKAKDNLKELAKDHGLIFFARSDCDYCHDQAPVLKWVEREMGIEVMAISLDGGPISMYPGAKKDNGISMMLSGGEGVTVVPAIYLVNRKTKEAIPIGTGVIAGNEIVERIWVLTKTKPGDEF